VEFDRSVVPVRLPPPSVLVWSLISLGVAAFVLGLVGGVAVLYLASEADLLGLAAAMWAILCWVVGCCVAVVLCALAWLCQSNYHRLVLAQRVASAQAPLRAGRVQLPPVLSAPGLAEGRPAVPGAGGAEAGAPDEPDEAGRIAPRASVERLLAELRELNVNVLLSETQRLMKGKYLAEREARRLTERIERAAAAGDMIEAEQCLDRLARLAPDSSGIERLRERVEQVRTEARARDLTEAQGRAEDLMAVGEYAEAEAVANGLLARHPSAPEAIALLERVRREAQAFANDQRAQMYRRVEGEASSRRWRSALAAAEELVEAYPSSPEADAVRAQLETLRVNARIEEVRQRRDQIGDLIARRRFGEALRLAREVIEKYPDTAAATELGQQLPRLEELATTGQGGQA